MDEIQFNGILPSTSYSFLIDWRLSLSPKLKKKIIISFLHYCLLIPIYRFIYLENLECIAENTWGGWNSLSI